MREIFLNICWIVVIHKLGSSVKLLGPKEKRYLGLRKEIKRGGWKKNEELDKLIKHENIVNYIKTQKLNLFRPYTKNAWSQGS